MSLESTNIGSYTPEHLGHHSGGRTLDHIDPIPWRGGEIDITLECSEFTSLCPVTSQPDFGKIIIRYRPKETIVETKSLKLYLASFRNRGAFGEDLVSTICRDLYEQLLPEWLEVEGYFNSRGGISIRALARLPQKKDGA